MFDENEVLGDDEEVVEAEVVPDEPSFQPPTDSSHEITEERLVTSEDVITLRNEGFGVLLDDEPVEEIIPSPDGDEDDTGVMKWGFGGVDRWMMDGCGRSCSLAKLKGISKKQLGVMTPIDFSLLMIPTKYIKK